jgi:hypothetical protein
MAGAYERGASWPRATAVSSGWPTARAAFKDGHPSRREMRDLFRERPRAAFPDPFEPAAEGSFVTWAVTPRAAGRAARSSSGCTALDAPGPVAPLAPLAARAGVLRKLARDALDPLQRGAWRAAPPLPPLAARSCAARPTSSRPSPSPAAAWTAWSSCAGSPPTHHPTQAQALVVRALARARGGPGGDARGCSTSTTASGAPVALPAGLRG